MALGGLQALAFSDLALGLRRERSLAVKRLGPEGFHPGTINSIPLCHIKYRIPRFKSPPAHLEAEATLVEVVGTVEREVEEVVAEVVEGAVEEGGGGNR